MTIHPERIRRIMRYAFAVAGNADDHRRRELGEIHLVKYVYLADLAHAAKHGEATYTGEPMLGWAGARFRFGLAGNSPPYMLPARSECLTPLRFARAGLHARRI